MTHQEWCIVQQMGQITKKFVPDSNLGHWIIYVDSVEVSRIPDNELSEELALIREIYNAN